MEQMLRQAINTGSTHYKNNVASELEMAQARLQLALENGDAASVARATAEISKATHALNEASRIASFPKEEYSEEHLNQVRAREYEDRLYSWLESNPEVDRNAPEYDEKMAGQVLSFIRGISNISVKRYGFENRFSSKPYLFVSLQVSFYFYLQNMSP